MENRMGANQTEWTAARKQGFDIKKSWPVIVIPILIVVMGALTIGAFMMGRASNTAGSADPASPAGPGGAVNGSGQDQQVQVGARPALGEDGRIGYATTGVIATDPESLQDQVDKMVEQANEPGVALEFKNLMVSNDGVNFSCYIGNSADNNYDMFITIYADPALSEELYLSELLRPGTRFEQVTFQKQLDPGVYTGYVVYTQVDDEEQADKTFIQVMHAQVTTTIEIVVNE